MFVKTIATKKRKSIRLFCFPWTIRTQINHADPQREKSTLCNRLTSKVQQVAYRPYAHLSPHARCDSCPEPLASSNRKSPALLKGKLMRSGDRAPQNTFGRMPLASSLKYDEIKRRCDNSGETTPKGVVTHAE